MAIVGFEFDKIMVDKKAAGKGSRVNISTNVNITNVAQNDLKLGSSSQGGVKFTFEFSSVYDPKVAKITLEGTVLYLADDKKVKAILDDWKKDKKVKKEIMSPVLNTVLTKCNIQSLILSNTVNLPPPIPMPKVSRQTGK